MVSSRASSRGGVRGVAFLPEELGGAQEQARAHLPAHHVGPLVDEQRQVAVALHPLARTSSPMMVSEVGRTISGSSSSPAGTQLAVRASFEAVVGDHRAFLGEALDVLGLLLRNDSGMNSGK